MARGRSQEVNALVLGKVDYRDADLIVTAFTDEWGKVAALARGARRSQKRFGGTLEPMHTLRFELEAAPRGELHGLKSSQIQKARPELLTELSRLAAAGKALSWVRRATTPHLADPILWHALSQCLDDLGEQAATDADDLVAAFGLRLLDIMGWGIHFSACVSCGKACPAGKAAWLNPERGGLVCRLCGGGPFQISGQAREELNRVACGLNARAPHDLAALTQKVVDRALAAHLGLERSR